MRRFARYLTAFMLVTAVAAWGLTSIVAYKTFTREILTSADLNSSFSRVITAANNLIALHPGDSTVTVRGVFDTLDASPGPNLNVIRTMVFRDNQDSLVVPGRISADTVKVDDQLWLGMTASVVGFSGGATAGTRLTFGSLVGVDSLRVRDSLNVQPGARSYLPRARIDSLLSGTATATVGFASSFTAGSRLNLGSVVRADSIWTGTTTPVVGFTAGSTAGTRFLWAYAKHDSNVVTWSDINGGTIDGTVIGGSTAAAGSFTKVAGSIAAQFSGGLTTNQIKATGKAVFSAASSVLMPASIQMPSGTDGYVLTSDGRGRVVLEAGTAASTVVDTTSTIAIPFSDGTSALPAITNLGDLNTGIYFPAADQVGVSVNGVRALLVSGDDITVRDDANVGDDLNLTSSGGVLNFNAGDVTLTHGAGKLTLGGDGAVEVDFANHEMTNVDINSGAIDGAAIGAASASTGAFSTLTVNQSAVDQPVQITSSYVSGATNALALTTTASNASDNRCLYITSTNVGAGNAYAVYAAAGLVNIQDLGASGSVSTDGSKNLTTASDRTWKRDYGPIQNATQIVRGFKPSYFDWQRDATGLLDDPRSADYVRRKALLDSQPRLAGFYSQDVYVVFPEGSPGGANTDSAGVEHWGLNSTAILAAVTASLQEQIDRVDSLTVVTARQDSLISALTARVLRLEGR